MMENTAAVDMKQDSETPAAGEEQTRNRKVYSPRTDIINYPDHILILTDVPGADDQSVSITLEKNILTIEAHPAGQKPEGYTLLFAEYGEGDYRRQFALSDQIDREKIEAVVRDGVLRLMLPKLGPAQAQKIKITAG
jgi:HSP20 family molecular chaperone IbpA